MVTESPPSTSNVMENENSLYSFVNTNNEENNELPLSPMSDLSSINTLRPLGKRSKFVNLLNDFYLLYKR